MGKIVKKTDFFKERLETPVEPEKQTPAAAPAPVSAEPVQKAPEEPRETLAVTAEPEVVMENQAPFTVSKVEDYYVVEGPAMVTLIDSINFSDEQSLNYFHRTLRSRGVIDALRAAGAQEGDTVAIYDMEFDFVE